MRSRRNFFDEDDFQPVRGTLRLRPSHPQAPSRHLVEILTVGLILVIVAFFASRAYIDSMGSADTVSCNHNIAQLARAMQAYATDYDGAYPAAGWQDAIMPQISVEPDWNIYYCPARKNEKGWSYGLNVNVAGLDDGRIPKPTETILLSDVIKDTREIWWANDIRYQTFDHNRNPSPSHRDRTNFAYCDGHVKTEDRFRKGIESWGVR